MHSRSRLRMLLCLAALTLLGLMCGINPQFTASPDRMVNARNITPTVGDGETTKAQHRPFQGQGAHLSLDVQNVGQVRSVLCGGCAFGYEKQEKERQYLIHMGEKVFPAYEAILSDPKSPFYEVCGVLTILRDVKGNRGRFLKHAISRLTDAKNGVRGCAVELLEEIGSPAEASPVVALLSDEDLSISYAAARTLAVIGGPNEVVAMDVWLRGVSHRDEADLRQYVKKHRDALKKRLDDHARDPSK